MMTVTERILKCSTWTNTVQFPKSYAVGIAMLVSMLALVLLVAVYFYMQASLRD